MLNTLWIICDDGANLAKPWKVALEDANSVFRDCSDWLLYIIENFVLVGQGGSKRLAVDRDNKPIILKGTITKKVLLMRKVSMGVEVQLHFLKFSIIVTAARPSS
jgi:hypothetical protein